MKNIFTKVKTTLAVATVVSIATLVNVSSADAASFELSWLGDQNYSAKGKFS